MGTQSNNNGFGSVEKDIKNRQGGTEYFAKIGGNDGDGGPNDMSARIEVLEYKIDTIQNDAKETKADIKAINHSINEMKVSLVQNNADAKETKADIKAINHSINEMKVSLVQNNADAKEAKEDIKAIKASSARWSGGIAALQWIVPVIVAIVIGLGLPLLLNSAK